MDAEDLEQLPFFRHGRDPNCDPEIAHTILELMDHAEQHSRDDAEARKARYRSKMDPARLESAWSLLKCECVLSLHGFGQRRKITSLVPLAGFPALERLFLAWNSIDDISPLASVPTLQCLSLKANQVADISALGSCRQLVSLDISENPVQELAPLDGLPALRKLTLSTSQVGGLARCKSLPALIELHVSGEGSVPPLARFPAMPQLRWLRLDGVTSLTGLERYPLIESVHFNGNDYDLAPVGQLPRLTTATFWSKGSFELATLRRCSELRYLNLSPIRVTGLEVLEGLAHLHEVYLSPDNTAFDRAVAKRFLARLTPWDVEFAQEPQSMLPSTDVLVVSEAEFAARRGDSDDVTLRPFDALLVHERDWLIERIEKAAGRIGLRVEDNGEKDLVIPYGGSDRRSHQVAVTSLKSYRAFRQVVMLIQQQLSTARNDWAMFCNSAVTNERESGRVKDFEVWLIRDKLITTEKYAATVRELLEAKPSLLDRIKERWFS